MITDIFLNRVSNEVKQTLGRLYLYDDADLVFQCCTMELPWINNQKRISCIPKGRYLVKKHTSSKYGECFWVQDVPDRTEILIHLGNYNFNTLGCILPGRRFLDINNDGLRDVISSGNTMKDLRKLLPNKFHLNIA